MMYVLATSKCTGVDIVYALVATISPPTMTMAAATCMYASVSTDLRGSKNFGEFMTLVISSADSGEAGTCQVYTVIILHRLETCATRESRMRMSSSCICGESIFSRTPPVDVMSVVS